MPDQPGEFLLATQALFLYDWGFNDGSAKNQDDTDRRCSKEHALKWFERHARSVFAAAPQPAASALERIYLQAEGAWKIGGERHMSITLQSIAEEAVNAGAFRAAPVAPVEQPAASTVPATSMEQAVDEFLADYEMRGEDAEGRDGCYRPTADELFVIKDAIMGLMADDGWLAAYHGAPSIGYSKEGGAAC